MAVEGHRELIEAMRDVNDAPVTTAKELAEELEVSRRTALRRLKEAREDGAVGRLKPSPKTAVWWPTQTRLDEHEPRDDQDGDDRDDQDGDDRDDQDGFDPAAVDVESDDTGETWTRERIASVVEDVSVPGAGATAETRRDAVLDALDHIRVVEESAAAAVRAAAFGVGSDALGYADENSAWKNCLQPAIKEARDEHGVPVEADNHGKWAWTG